MFNSKDLIRLKLFSFMKAIIIHGTYGNPNENWFPWLKCELEYKGWDVRVPKFPTPEGQTLENWMKVFEEIRDFVDEDTIFIAHSLGPAFVLSILEDLDFRVAGCFFVAGFVGGALGVPEVDKINKSFTEKDFDWDKIKKNCGYFRTYFSDNDPFVPMKRSLEFSDKLMCDFDCSGGAGHFNSDAGYTRFEGLLKDILDKY